MMNNLTTANNFALVVALLGAHPDLLINTEVAQLRHAAFASKDSRTVPAWIKLTGQQKKELAMRAIINRYNHQ
jgi:hypothetical protein